MSIRHGGQILADQLTVEGIRRVFSVPGESFLAALDGLHSTGIENIVCRHEGAAAMMAEAYGKLTGQPGVAFVTRGPGATNASSGVHIARQDSTPMLLFVGQIECGHRDREAFQEVNYRQMFGGLAKWVAEIDQVDRLPEYIARAFQVAQSGRPGPVILALPEDMLSSEANCPTRPKSRPSVQTATHTDAAQIAKAIGAAHRPLVIAGGPGWSSESAQNLAKFAKNFHLPISVPFRRQDYIDNRNPHYVGDLGVGMNPALGRRLQEADCLLLLGARLGDTATNGYTLLDPASHGKTILHVHPDPDEPGHVYHPDLAVAASSGSMVAQLAALSGPADPVWADWTSRARRDYEDWQIPQDTPGSVKLERVMTWLSDTLAEDAIVTNGAGNYAAFLHRYFTYKRFGTQLAPTSGSMGYGVPAAISAKLEHPDRDVICLAGDGCFQMTLNELSTAAQYQVPVTVLVVNNGKYGTIRMHQEMSYPGRVSGTALFNPDFAALARAYGGFGVRVTNDAEFSQHFAAAQNSGTLSVIELVIDDEVLTTGQTLTEVREAATVANAQPDK
ncbi:MAG: thiamine pyrophosphate-binding protein [Pseudomonadota bacterium]